ncbi:MAG: flagellar hook-associated protein FlgK [Nitrospiraceae bacterium]|nr:MAG: flagellar hook-associated protein FlgK [Nitrospiraceae bacterium]
MSLFGLFDIGRSALFASQAALNVVSNNIANVNTPGYSRQEVVLQLSNPVQVNGDFIGRGVNVADIKRHYDKFLHLQIIGQNQSFGRSFALDQGLSQIEQIFNEARGLGLAGPLDGFFNAWQEVATNPEGQAQRSILLEKAKALVQTAKQMEGDITDTIEDINEEIENIVTDINALTSQIADLNDKIVQLEAGFGTEKASYIRDQRDQRLNELAELMNYTWYEEDNGAVNILVGGKSLVTSQGNIELSTSVDSEGDTTVTYNGSDVSSIFTKGRLGGFIDVRDDIRENPLISLRRLIASLTNELNALHSSGYGLDSSTGNDFFSALQIYTRDYSSGAYISSAVVADSDDITLDEYDINFTDASTYDIVNHTTGETVASGQTYSAGSTITIEGIDVVIDGSPAAGDSFFVSPLTGVIEDFEVEITDTGKIAAASSDLALPGDNTKALEIYQLYQTGVSGLGDATFESYYRGIVSNVGVTSKAASDGLNFDDNMLFELQKKREEASGVSIDEEATNLIRYQRAFEAGARILKMTDELLETLINL